MTMSNTLSHREFIQVAFQGDHSLSDGYTDPTTFVTSPINPGTGRYTGGKVQLVDAGRRGRDAAAYGAQEGVGEATSTFECNIRVAEGDEDQMAMIGYLIANILETDDYTPVDAGTTGRTDNKIHTLVPGETKKFLQLRRGVAGRYTWLLRDALVTNLTIRFNIARQFATFTATLMSQDREEVKPPIARSAIPSESGLLIPGWTCLADLPNGTDTVSRRRFGGKVDTDPDDFLDFKRDLMTMEWVIDRGNQRHYGAEAEQKMRDMFRGPLNSTCAMSLIYRDPDAAKLYTQKVQGRLAANAIADAHEAARTANEGQGFRIVFPLADFGNDFLNEDLSGIHAGLRFACLGIADGIKKAGFDKANADVDGPVAFQVIQHQKRDDKFTAAVPADGKVSD